MIQKICIIGIFKETHIGRHFLAAARKLNLNVDTLDSEDAYRSSWLKTKFYWHFKGHQPPLLRVFSKKVVAKIAADKPDLILTMGIAPVDVDAVREIKMMGCRLANYSSDDPFNYSNSGRWFLKTLSFYDTIFSCRKANMAKLRDLGCRRVLYLPFGYEPEIHYRHGELNSEDRKKYDSDVLFIGGADRDRVRYLEQVAEMGLNLHLYGAYWQRHKKLKKYAKGPASPEVCRKAVAGSKVCLGLVREANHDDQSMRSFEIPAMGGCFLLQNTDEHRRIFGGEGNDVLYFNHAEEMKIKLQRLISNEHERHRLSQNAHNRITQGGHSYFDRFKTILERASET